MNKNAKKLLPWLCAAIVLLVIFGTMYLLAQQALRQGANDPQIQLAEDTAAQLNGGTPPQSLVTGKVDIAASLAPFIIIYDGDGRIVAGNGYLDGQIA